jgi:hypothetical protein
MTPDKLPDDKPLNEKTWAKREKDKMLFDDQQMDARKRFGFQQILGYKIQILIAVGVFCLIGMAVALLISLHQHR